MSYTQYDYKRLKDMLYDLSDEKYRTFHSGLVPGQTDILGIRVPVLRTVAKEILKNDWRGYLKEAKDDCYEEVMLQGMVISAAKCDIDEKLKNTAAFVPKIDNWAICDTFCTGLKDAKKHLEKVFEFIKPYLNSDKEFYIRFAVVMLMSYYTDDDYIDDTLTALNSISHDGYYVKMAVAWALSVCFVKQRDKTLELFNNNRLDDFTFNKALQKCRESYRVTKADKDMLNSMKRRGVPPQASSS